MKKRDRSHANMQLTIKVLIEDNSARFAFNPAFIEAKIKYDEAITILQKLSQKQDELKYSSNLSKVEAHQAAVMFIYQVSAQIASFAFDTHNTELRDKVSVTYSEIRKLPANAFIARSETILECAKAYLSQLGSYGITPHTNTDGKNLLIVFDREIKKQAKCKLQLKSVTCQLNEQVTITDKLIDPFDAIVETQRISDPN